MKKTDLINDVKKIIVTTLDLEDVTIDDIRTDMPLFDGGLDLDSIDSLNLGMALTKVYGVSFSADTAQNKKYFYSVSTLVDYIITDCHLQIE